MSLISRILIGLAIAAVGVFMVLRTSYVLDFFGSVDWADRYLGSTSLFYKLLGIVLALVGFIVMTNMWDAFLMATLGSVIPK